jgi:eukaryotic-like serine/threonine-protein kinase
MIGETLGHYRVVAKLAAGGMGVVYRAHDEQLDRDVALKVLPAGRISNPESRYRFKKEALVLAKLNHPNIETVHEFGSHGDTDFLAMELIPGVTVIEKLRQGPLPEIEVLRLGVQFAEGLSAAHEQNIIHRDLKPGNLMVMPNGRLKILDFGLAILMESEVAADLTITAPSDGDALAGTVPYMSPEQLRGQTLDQRSDIFAAGAVLYEMATGRRPFPQVRSAEVMGAILHKTPDPPSSLNPNISPGLESIICTALEKEPASRYHTAREMRAALEGISASGYHRPSSATVRAWREEDAAPAGAAAVAPASAATPASGVAQAKPSPPLAKWWPAAAAALLLAILGAGFAADVGGLRSKVFHRDSAATNSGAGTSLKVRRSVAVLGFKNISGQHDKDWESTALGEMLTTEMGAGGQLRTVSGEEVAQMKAGLALPDADSYGQDTLQKIYRNLSADLIVVGSFVPLPDGQTRIDVRLQDAAQGTTLASVSKKGNDLDALARDVGTELRDKIGVTGVSLEQSAEVKAAMPATPEATRLYAEGVSKLRAFDNVAARDLLQKAVIADPNSAMIHSALTAAYAALGYDEKARQSARNAFDLSAKLSREDRLLVEARFRESNKEWDHATQSYSTLFGFFPDNADYGLALARTQITAGQAKASADAIESLRRLPAPAGNDPRIDLVAADAALSQGSFKQAADLATTASTKAKTNGANLIVARALLVKAQALESLTQLQAASVAAAESRSLYVTSKDRHGEQGALEVEANILADQGDLSGALTKYKEDLNIAHEIGNRHAEASALNNMALVLKGQDDVEGAQKMWEQALLGFHDVSDKPNSAQVLINIGGNLLDRGDLAGAKKTYGQALDIFREVNDQSGIATATAAIGTVLYAQGEPAEARKTLEQAIAMDLATGGRKTAPTDKLLSLADVLQQQGDLKAAEQKYQDSLTAARTDGDKSSTAYALFSLGKLALLAGNFPAAENDFNQSLATRKEIGEKRNAAQTQVAMAQLALEEGKLADAMSLSTEAREDFRKMHYRDDELAATAVLMRVYLAQGKTDAADRERSAETAQLRATQSLATRLDFSIASASVDAAKGKNADANAQLKSSMAKAASAGMLGCEFESRLALAQVNSKSLKAAEARSSLEQLQQAANDKGFLLIARKAASIKLS